MNARKAIAAALLAAAAALPTARAFAAGDPAQDAGAAPPQRTVSIYRCTDAAGHVTLQNDVPCPKGSRQERQVVDVPPPLPAYVPREERMPAVVAAERADEAKEIAAALQPLSPADAPTDADTPAGESAGGTAPAAKPGPPPPLYACRAWDGSERLTESATPQERCAPLRVVGLDGSVRNDAAACEKIADQCTPVAPADLCEAWRRRVDEAEFRWKFAGAKQDDARRREYALLAATFAHSDCPAR